MKVIHKRKEVVLHKYHFNDIPNDKAKTRVVQVAIDLLKQMYALDFLPNEVSSELISINPLIKWVRVEDKTIIKIDAEIFFPMVFRSFQKLPAHLQAEVNQKIVLNSTLRNHGTERLKIV